MALRARLNLLMAFYYTADSGKARRTLQAWQDTMANGTTLTGAIRKMESKNSTEPYGKHWTGSKRDLKYLLKNILPDHSGFIQYFFIAGSIILIKNNLGLRTKIFLL
ncbi:MAG: hypothetical protein KL787_08915 [Taibaiella sp.]|nr:hypothetical protein [Taibaiella sp.]